MKMREAVIVTAVRTPVGKAGRGALRLVRPEDLAAYAIRAAVERTPGLVPEAIDDVILGCAMPEGEQGLNIGRIAALRAELPDNVPALTVNRFCSSGLQAIAFAAERIQAGAADVIVAGGVESMSQVPMSGYRPLPHPYLVEHRPEVYMAMGHTAEEVARRYGISRERQDAFALSSHQKAAAAQRENRFQDELTAVKIAGTTDLQRDEGVRPDTSLSALAALKPAFQEGGTVTAGNSSQMSDGAAALVLMSRERAVALGLRPLAVYRSFAVSGVAPEVMGIGPVAAIPKALRLAGIRQQEVGLIELNEAFAAQCAAVIQELKLDEARVNVNGGAIALGHPLGCTGAKLTVTLLHEARKRGERYGVVTMCIGGGMGAAAVFESEEGSG